MYTAFYIKFYIYLCVFYRCCILSLKHVKLNWQKMPERKKITWKIFGETWYRSRVVAAKTKPLYPLAYRVFNTEMCAWSFNLLTQYKFAIQEFRLMLNVILRIQYGAVRVKWHHFWIQHTWIYQKTSLALVYSSVLDKIYLLWIFNQEVLWQNNSVFMKFWDT